MIEKAIAYKKTDKDFISSLKKLGLSENEINFILKKYKRKNFDDGGDGSSGGDGGSSGGNANGDGDGQGDGQGEGQGQGEGEGEGEAQGQEGFGLGPSDQGFGIGPGDTNSVGPSDQGFGIGPNDQAVAEAVASVSEPNEPAEEPGIMGNIPNAIKNAFADVMANPMATIAGFVSRPLGMVATALSAMNRGVTAPNDYSQMDTSVQSNPSQSPNNGGGINTTQSYAPLYNTSTGDNTADAMRTRLENLLRPQQPTTYGLPSINPYSNYTLLDLKNLRG